MTQRLFTLLYWGFFVTTLPLCFATILFAFLLTIPFDRDRRLVHLLVCSWCALYLRAPPGWRVRVEGRVLLPRGACVLVANHQSMADILAAAALFRPFRFVSKASLFRVPLLGWIMRLAGYVKVERGRPDALETLREACRVWLRRGVPVLLFPEGTYATGDSLLPFKLGAFHLAIEQGVPLVPITIEGTRALIDGDGPWMSPRAVIRVRVRAPLAAGTLGLDPAALAERVRALFVDALAPGGRPVGGDNPLGASGAAGPKTPAAAGRGVPRDAERGASR